MSAVHRLVLLGLRASGVIFVIFAVAACAGERQALSLEASAPSRVDDPLPSWSEGPAREALLGFVSNVTDVTLPTYVPPEARIAVFDNDGTLWTEQPMYTEMAFTIDRVKTLAAQHPEWKNEQPFEAVLAGDLERIAAIDESGLHELLFATRSGVTTAELDAIVSDWLATARHPTLHRPYTDCVYQPMLELLAYLRSNGFTTFIVSGGGLEFMRAFTEAVYDIPPEQVVGTRLETRFTMRDGMPVLILLPELAFVDDEEGKPKGIHTHIGRRPILAFGNSDGDRQMLEWTTIGRTPSLGLLLHHTDAVREAAYDRHSRIGHLEVALDEARSRGWVVVDMKSDWKRVFAPE